MYKSDKYPIPKHFQHNLTLKINLIVERLSGAFHLQPIQFLVGFSSVRIGSCDKWGGGESRGNGTRPVELMILNDCATHRSRVPRRSYGGNKRRSDDSGRRERTRPGL